MKTAEFKGLFPFFQCRVEHDAGGDGEVEGIGPAIHGEFD